VEIKMTFTTILLKLSGEALQDKSNNDVISATKIKLFVDEIESIYKNNLKIAIIVGGGNVIRGANFKSLGLSRFKADNMGMLATVINSIALEDCLNSRGIKSKLFSAIEMNKICDFYKTDVCKEYLSKGYVVIISGGISNPYFSTDTGAVLRALEIGADVVLKGTQVDGVYNKDPKIYQDATKYDNISYDKVVENKLGIMDLTAVLLAQKEKLPIIVFNIHQKGHLKDVINDKNKRSIIQ
jgi:uridylate kinase